MESRREFFIIFSSSIGVSFAGCTGTNSETTPTPRQSGESVTYDGVQAGVSNPFISSGPLFYKKSGQENTKTKTPREGGRFLFYHISLENSGENERWFPEGDDVKLYLNGEEAGDEYGSLPGKSVTLDGTTYDSVFRKIYEKDADAGVFPGVKIEGWNMHEVPAGIELSSALVGISLGRTPEGAVRKEFFWRLS